MHIFDLVVEFEEFKAQYLEAANNFDKVTRFWNTFNPDPIGLLNNRQFLHLRDRLFELLRVCKGIDSVAFSKIHKGHPHYFNCSLFNKHFQFWAANISHSIHNFLYRVGF